MKVEVTLVKSEGQVLMALDHDKGRSVYALHPELEIWVPIDEQSRGAMRDLKNDLPSHADAG